jgi:hypothetical protein
MAGMAYNDHGITLSDKHPYLQQGRSVGEEPEEPTEGEWTVADVGMSWKELVSWGPAMDFAPQTRT